MEFEWDQHKAEANISKHGVSFHEAGTVFGDNFAITYPDPDQLDWRATFYYIWFFKHEPPIRRFSYRTRGYDPNHFSAPCKTKGEKSL